MSLTLTADLKTDQILNATSDAVVVRFDDSNCSDVVDELDEILADDRPHEFVIHYRTSLMSVWYPKLRRFASFRNSPKYVSIAVSIALASVQQGKGLAMRE